MLLLTSCYSFLFVCNDGLFHNRNASNFFKQNEIKRNLYPTMLKKCFSTVMDRYYGSLASFLSFHFVIQSNPICIAMQCVTFVRHFFFHPCCFVSALLPSPIVFVLCCVAEPFSRSTRPEHTCTDPCRAAPRYFILLHSIYRIYLSTSSATNRSGTNENAINEPGPVVVVRTGPAENEIDRNAIARSRTGLQPCRKETLFPFKGIFTLLYRL